MAKKVFEGIMYIVLWVYGMGITLYDFYFAYLWIVEPDKQSHFIQCILNLITFALFGWIWTTLKAIIWPYWFYVQFIV
jgi:hypothetical protein